jgi:hypothetical protein
MQIIEETYGLFELPVNEGKQKLQVQVWKPPEPGWVKVNTGTEIRCLAIDKTPMNSTMPCTSILAVRSKIGGPDDMNSPSLQCPATARVVQ